MCHEPEVDKTALALSQATATAKKLPPDRPTEWPQPQPLKGSNTETKPVSPKKELVDA